MPKSCHPRSTDVFILLLSAMTCLVIEPLDAARAVDIVELQVGFDDSYKTGAWTPVAVTIEGGPENTSGRLVLTAADDEGGLCEFACRFPTQADVPANDRQDFTGYVCIGRRPTSLTVRLELADSVITKTWQPNDDRVVASTQQWVLLVGSQENTFSVARLLDRPTSQEVRVLHLQDARQLPRHWFGLRGFDLIVLCGSKPTAWQQLQPAQWTAIDQWTKLGGQLMLSVGEHADELLASGRPAERFIPGDFERRTYLPTTTQIESFAGASERLDLILQSIGFSEGGAGEGGLPIALVRNPRGEVAAAEPLGDETVPIVIRGLYGLGQITFVALDLDSEPMKRWSGRTRFILQLLDLTIDKGSPGKTESYRGQVTHLGFSDVSGQLRAALQQFPGVRLVPFALIAGFAALYVLIIGPGDYYLLRKLSNNMQWSWITFPLTALAVCCLAVYLSERWKGNQPRINQVDLVDWDVASNVVRGENWTHFFSPTATALDCRLRFENVVTELPPPNGSLLSWHGLPGQSFGGMDGRFLLRPATRPYTISLTAAEQELESEILGLPVAVASSRAIRTHWWSFDADEIATDVRRSSGGYLQGSVPNPFGADLRDCVLLYDRWYYRLGLLAANDTFTIGEQSPDSLKSLLIRRRTIDEDTRTIAAWDQRSFDVARIMEMIMFHEAAGGRDYTGLVHRHESWLDLSHHVAAGRAVLVGRVSRRATSVITSTDEFPDGAIQDWTVCRLIMPVTDDEPTP